MSSSDVWNALTTTAISQKLFMSTAQPEAVTTEFDRETVIAQITEKLSEKYGDISGERIEKVVREEVDLLAERPVHDYVSVLGERAAKKRLKDERVDQRHI